MVLDIEKLLELTPEEALRYFEGLNISPIRSWREYEQDSFAISGVMKIDILEDVRNEVQKAIRDGMPIDEFKRNILFTLAKRGWLSHQLTEEENILSTPWRVNLIYRQNLQNSYMAGRLKQQMKNSENKPYWQYVGILDDNTRPSHAEIQKYFEDKALHYSSSFWQSHYPPNGFNCRCRVVAYSAEEARKKGLKLITSISKTFLIDEGFNHSPIGNIEEMRKRVEEYRK